MIFVYVYVWCFTMERITSLGESYKTNIKEPAVTEADCRLTTPVSQQKAALQNTGKTTANRQLTHFFLRRLMKVKSRWCQRCRTPPQKLWPQMLTDVPNIDLVCQGPYGVSGVKLPPASTCQCSCSLLFGGETLSRYPGNNNHLWTIQTHENKTTFWPSVR